MILHSQNYTLSHKQKTPQAWATVGKAVTKNPANGCLINGQRSAEPEIIKLFLRGETASCSTASEADEVPP